MDTALKNGDFAPAGNGMPKRISGKEELFQRAAIRLCVPLGSFVYDAALGSRIPFLRADDPSLLECAAFLAKEALRPAAELSVSGARPAEDPDAGVLVSVACGGETREIEVKFHGQL